MPAVVRREADPWAVHKCRPCVKHRSTGFTYDCFNPPDKATFSDFVIKIVWRLDFEPTSIHPTTQGRRTQRRIDDQSNIVACTKITNRGPTPSSNVRPTKSSYHTLHLPFTCNGPSEIPIVSSLKVLQVRQIRNPLHHK